MILKFIFKMLKRCSHCGHKDVKEWNDSELTALRGNNPIKFGYCCNKCRMITV